MEHQQHNNNQLPWLVRPLWWEQNLPYICTAAIGILYWFMPEGIKCPAKLSELLSAVMQISAVFAGFIGTAMSLIMALNDSPPIRKLKVGKGKFYNSLMDYMWHAFWCQLILLVWAIICLLALDTNSRPCSLFFIWILYVLLTLTLTSSARIFSILKKIFKQM